MTTRSCDVRCGRGAIVVCAAADVDAGAAVLSGAPTGAVADAVADPDGPRGAARFEFTPSVFGAANRPIVTYTYATRSGASGHGTLIQLPRLRNTGIAVPRATCPITGVPILGPL